MLLIILNCPGQMYEEEECAQLRQEQLVKVEADGKLCWMFKQTVWGIDIET